MQYITTRTIVHPISIPRSNEITHIVLNARNSHVSGRSRCHRLLLMYMRAVMIPSTTANPHTQIWYLREFSTASVCSVLKFIFRHRFCITALPFVVLLVMQMIMLSSPHILSDRRFISGITVSLLCGSLGT